MAGNEVRHLACYADAVDTNVPEIASWTTSASNYLHIFTPRHSIEVGVSQRHAGVWQDTGAFTVDLSGGQTDVAIRISSDDVWIEGLQIHANRSGGSNGGVNVTALRADGRVRVSECIIRGDNATVGSQYFGVDIWDTPSTAVLEVVNNVIYGFGGSAGIQSGIWAESGERRAVNNTVVSCAVGARTTSHGAYVGSMLASNNIFYGCSTAASGSFLSGTGNNATELASFVYSVAGGAGTDFPSSSFGFVSESNKNFHLANNDTGARSRGAAIDSVSTDIDGDSRPQGAGWDIGADEVP